MQRPLLDFIRVLRSHDLRISPAETLDALGAVDALGYDDRERLRSGLAATLAKSQRDEESFHLLFDRFFGQLENDFSEVDSQATAGDATAAAAENGAGGDDAAENATADGGSTGSSARSGDSLLEQAANRDPGLRELLATPLMQGLRENRRGELNARLRRAAREAGVADMRLFTQKGL
jgi:uncharacterized protein with von Willebrand factor type A (vWA) domain